MSARIPSSQIAFRYRPHDSEMGVTRETAQRLAQYLGVDETQAIHHALRALVVRVLPQYQPDAGALSAEQIRQIKSRVGKIKKGALRSSLVEFKDH